MKKQILLLPVIPLLCLVSCNKGNATIVKYRNNFTKNELFESHQSSGDKLAGSKEVEYDEKGLPIKETDTVYLNPFDEEPTPKTVTYTYSREFDNNNHEIKHHETSSGDEVGEATSTLVYDGDFLIEETVHSEKIIKETAKITLDAQCTHSKFDIGEKGAYLIVDEEYYEKVNTDLDNANSTNSYGFDFRLTTYDRLDRMTMTLGVFATENRLEDNSYFAANPDINANLSLVHYLSENNDTNVFINLTAGIDLSNEEASFIKIKSLGYETYSNKNLIAFSRRIDNVATFTPTSSSENPYPNPRAFVEQEYKYDELDRLILIEETQITSPVYKITIGELATIFSSPKDTISGLVDSASNAIGVTAITTTQSYTYNGDRKQPSEIKNETYQKLATSDETYKRISIARYDDYGRLLSTEQTTTREASEEIIYTATTKQKFTYADPIRIPEGEKLAERIMEMESYLI